MKSKLRLLSVPIALTALALLQNGLRADQDVTLPAPLYLETFDDLAELGLPAGWKVTNETSTDVAGENIDNLHSDTYKNWVAISADRLQTLKAGALKFDPITLNGVAVDSLASGNLFYCESDARGGNQVQYLFTSDYNLTGKTNVYAAFNSLYEQNQDNVAGVEYSIDGGTTWLPALYYLYGRQDTGQGGPDILFDGIGNIDANATLNTPRSDQAYGRAYGAFFGAPVTPETAVYLQGRINDNATDGKRIEVIRLPKADNQSKVRFRFHQAGTGSWYWGIDNFGIYSLPEARIAVSPYTLPSWGHNAQVNIGGSVTFNVAVSGTGPISYQWLHTGTPIAGATGATLTISNAKPTDAGEYTVKVKNSLAEVTSDPSVLSVLAIPQIDTAPKGVILSAGAPFSLTVVASGPAPLSYQWQKNQQNIANATSATYAVVGAVAGDAGLYRVVVSNGNGSTTSDEVKVAIFNGPITQDLVVHLPLDTNANDTSGKANNGTPESQTLADGTDPGLPTFSSGGGQRVGAGALRIKDGQAVNLGHPDDLLFGDSIDFTVSFWVKAADANAWTGDPAFLGNKNWTSGSSRGYVVAAQGSGAWKWNWRAADAGRRDVGFPNIADNVWHNLVMSHDRHGNASFYVDGVLKATQPIAGDGDIDDTNLSTYIGQDGTGGYGFANDQGAHFKDILLDDFGIWRRVVTQQEISSIYAHGLVGEDLTKASGEPVVLPPNVTAGPLSQVINAGSSVTLSATVDGTAPFTYKWQKNNTDISGATGATYTLSNVDATAAGTYRVIVTNPKGSATSLAARIGVVTGGLDSGLVAYLKFDNTYADASGHGNNATAKGNPTFEAGKLGKALRFTTVKNGSQIDYATLGKPADLNFGDATDFSVSYWANWTASEDDLPFVSNKDWNSSNNTGWGVFSQGGGNLRIQATGTPSGSANKVSSSATPNIRDGQWHHVLTSFWRGVVASTYVDGKLVNSLGLTTTGSIDAGLDTNIGQDGTGKYTDGGSVLMTGLIDDVAFWRRVVTGQEAGTIYTAGQQSKDLSTLVGVVVAPTIAVTRGVGVINLTWEGTGYTLESSPTLGGTYTAVAGAGANSATVPTTASQLFLRVKK